MQGIEIEVWTDEPDELPGCAGKIFSPLDDDPIFRNAGVLPYCS
jgi:hypothetical protein